MSYYWRVVIEYKAKIITRTIKAGKAHTAISIALKLENDPYKASISYERLAKIQRTKCDVCGSTYDNDDSDRHLKSWKHRSAMKGE